jgi:hypothetical protein
MLSGIREALQSRIPNPFNVDVFSKLDTQPLLGRAPFEVEYPTPARPDAVQEVCESTGRSSIGCYVHCGLRTSMRKEEEEELAERAR